MSKTQENRVRRTAARRGFDLRKTRRRDPLAEDYGFFSLEKGGKLVAIGPVDFIEAYLEKNKKPATVSGAGPT